MSAWVETLSQYGPFPLGVFLGIMIARWGFDKQVGYMNKTQEELQREKQALITHIETQNGRIEKLHDKLGEQRE